MRRFALVCALLVLGIARESAQAQSTTPATAPNFETERFSSSELLRGKRITQAECAALPGAVWVVVDQQGKCTRYEKPPDADDPPLNTSAVLSHGVVVSESQCKDLRNAVWVRVDGAGY